MDKGYGSYDDTSLNTVCWNVYKSPSSTDDEKADALLYCSIYGK
ncbi:hypothetical protein [Candidatus Mycoplasma haematohominis]